MLFYFPDVPATPPLSHVLSDVTNFNLVYITTYDNELSFFNTRDLGNLENVVFASY